MAKNIHIYPSTIEYESRILNETHVLAKHQFFDSIDIVGLHSRNLPTTQIVDESRQIRRLKTGFEAIQLGPVTKSLSFIVWYINIFIQYGFNRKLTCINCHALTVLPVCVLLKFTTGSKLVYDTHELETETASSSALRKRVSKLVERALIGFCDATIVVGDAIADHYKSSYGGSRPTVIRNLPERLHNNDGSISEFDIRTKLNFSKNDLIFIYPGVFGEGRGITTLLDAFRLVAEKSARHHVVFMGYGELENVIKDQAQCCPNIHVLDAVPSDQVVSAIKSADAGFCLIENLCLSYYYSCPNKLFQILAAGRPVIGSEFPEIEQVIEESSAGWAVSQSSEIISNLVVSLSKKNLEIKKRNAKAWSGDRSWQQESEPRMIALYSELFQNKA